MIFSEFSFTIESRSVVDYKGFSFCKILDFPGSFKSQKSNLDTSQYLKVEIESNGFQTERY